jgi:hypothetical protein
VLTVSDSCHPDGLLEQQIRGMPAASLVNRASDQIGREGGRAAARVPETGAAAEGRKRWARGGEKCGIIREDPVVHRMNSIIL